MDLSYKVGWLTGSKHGTMMGVWADPNPHISKIWPHIHRCKGVRVHPHAHPQHMKVLKYFNTCNMDVRSRVGWFTASKHDTMMLFGLTLSPIFPKFGIWPPPAQVQLCKGAPICLSAAYEVAKTLHKH